MEFSIWCRCHNSLRMLKKTRLLTRPTPAAMPPARPESAKTASWPRDAPFRGQAAASEEARRYGLHFVGPFARAIDLGERKSPSSASDFRETLVESLSDATCLREALRQRQGTPLADFFSILLEDWEPHDDSSQERTNTHSS